MKSEIKVSHLTVRLDALVDSADHIPSAIIGSGGTAVRISRCVKACNLNSGSRDVPILVCDSDPRENEKYPELPKLKLGEELIILDSEVAVRTLTKAQERHPGQSHDLESIPDEIDGEINIRSTAKVKIATGNGAGQFRRAGELLFNTNVGAAGANLLAKLQQLRLILIGLLAKQTHLHNGRRPKDRIRLFVVVSISGGQGAGAIKNLLALIRLVFPEDWHEITLICVLPGEALDRELKNRQEMPVTRANAIATLSEIQAIRTGKITPLTIRFDHEHSIVIRDGAAFANSVYLVDNTSVAGNPVNSYMSLCRAVGHFLYAFLGTGMAAAQASAAINVLDAKTVDGQPFLYSALGVSYAEFPAHLLRRFTVLTATSKWAEQWMTTTAENAGTKAADAILIELGLTDADSWRETIHRQLAVGSYAILGERREKLLSYGCTDERFFSEVQKYHRRVQDDVRDYLDRLPPIESEARRSRFDALNQRFTSLYGENLGNALDAFAEVTRRLGLLKSTLTRESETNARNRTTIEAGLAELEIAIRRKNLPPPFSDKPERSRYLGVLKQRAELDIADATLAARLAIVQAVEDRAAELLRQVQILHADLRQERERIADECQRLENTAGPDEFGTWVISASDFPSWASKLSDKLAVQVPLDASQLDAGSVLAGAVNAIDKPIWDSIARIDLANIIKSDETVRRRVQALGEMARPLMQFTPTAPLESELLPMTFMAGNLPDHVNGKKFVEETISSLRGTTWEPIHTGNPHLWICVNVRRGFAVTHWAGFEAANRFYLSQRGKSHTLPNWQAVPTLHHTSRDEQEAQTNLGLGLFTEMIRRRGSNYYVNVEKARNAGSKDRLKYATFAKERGPAGRALVEHGLVEEAMASERMPDDALLGNSLESAVMALRQPVFAETSGMIRATLDELGRTKLGYVELKRQLLAWIETQLVPEVDKSTTRRDLLQSIAERLKSYADALGKQV